MEENTIKPDFEFARNADEAHVAWKNLVGTYSSDEKPTQENLEEYMRKQVVAYQSLIMKNQSEKKDTSFYNKELSRWIEALKEIEEEKEPIVTTEIFQSIIKDDEVFLDEERKKLSLLNKSWGVAEGKGYKLPNAQGHSDIVGSPEIDENGKVVFKPFGSNGEVNDEREITLEVLQLEHVIDQCRHIITDARDRSSIAKRIGHPR